MATPRAPLFRTFQPSLPCVCVRSDHIHEVCQGPHLLDQRVAVHRGRRHRDPAAGQAVDQQRPHGARRQHLPDAEAPLDVRGQQRGSRSGRRVWGLLWGA
eukprot:2524300-Prymnesium_polylepis.2